MSSAYTELAVQYAELPVTGLFAGTSATGHPVSSLLDADLGATWQTTGVSTIGDTYLTATIGSASPTTSVFLTRHNARPGALWRVQGDTSTIGAPPRVDPTAVSGAGVSGAATDIDEGVDTFSKSDQVTVNPGSTAEIVLGDASGSLALGDHMQAIRLSIDTSTSEFGGLVSFALVDNSTGTTLTTWDEVPLNEHDQVVELYFNGSLKADGSELRVDVGWSASAGFVLSIWAVEWRPELASAATGADSGWLEMVPTPEVFGLDFDDRPSHLVRGTAAHHFIANGVLSPQPYRSWRVSIRDPNNLDGFLRASHLGFGPSARLRLQDGLQIRPVDTSTRVRMANGDLWVNLGPTYHVMQLPLRALSGEGPRDLLAIRSRAGSKPMGVTVLPSEPEASALSMRAMLTDGGITHRNGRQASGDTRAIGWTDTMTFEEV